MPIAEVEEILIKFKKDEEKIEQILIHKNLRNRSDNHDQLQTSTSRNNILSPSQAIERNMQLLKELETVKGNLRSKAIFSPSELQWEKICKQYQRHQSLPVTTWKCHLPLYV